MVEADVARILLVRSIEECDAGSIDAAAHAEAFSAAGDCTDVPSWFVRRASCLLSALPRREMLFGVLDIRRLPDFYLWSAPCIAFVLGVLANHFAPSNRIHLLFNPIVAVIVWNVCLYVGLALSGVRKLALGRRGGQTESIPRRRARLTHGSTGEGGAAAASSPFVLRLVYSKLLWRFWLWSRSWYAHAHDVAGSEKRFAASVARFLEHWYEVARDLSFLRVKRLVHLSALGLVAGAIAGMYFRGLFLDYNVIWRSTFIRSDAAISVLVHVLLGPAAYVLGIDLDRELDLGRLTGGGGIPAASWIHLYSFTALLLVVFPRAGLAAWETWRIRLLSFRVELDFDEEYFRSRLQQWRESRKHGLVGDIRSAYLTEARKLAAQVGDHVCVRLYDTAIATEIRQFSETGGRLVDLERRIQDAADRFGGELEAYLQDAERGFEERLAAKVTAIVERQVGGSFPGGHASRRAPLDASATRTADHWVMPIGDDLVDVVSVGVTAAVALALGTVSGGFGKALGAAILVGLVHSGPLAFVLGAIGGMVVAAGAMWFGREAMKGAVREFSLPPALTGMLLREARIRNILKDGRAKTRDAVIAQVLVSLNPFADTVAEEIWQRIDPPSRRDF